MASTLVLQLLDNKSNKRVSLNQTPICAYILFFGSAEVYNNESELITEIQLDEIRIPIEYTNIKHSLLNNLTWNSDKYQCCSDNYSTNMYSIFISYHIQICIYYHKIKLYINLTNTIQQIIDNLYKLALVTMRQNIVKKTYNKKELSDIEIHKIINLFFYN